MLDIKMDNTTVTTSSDTAESTQETFQMEYGAEIEEGSDHRNTISAILLILGQYVRP